MKMRTPPSLNVMIFWATRSRRALSLLVEVLEAGDDSQPDEGKEGSDLA